MDPDGNGLQRGQFCWPPLGKTVDRQRAATWPPLGRISWPPTIGIDSHKDTLAGCLIDAAGEAVEHRSIPNTAAGHAELVVWARTEPHRGLRRFWSVLGFARSACLIFDVPYSGDRRRAHLWAVRLSARRVSAVAAAAHGGVERAGQNSSLKPLHVHRVAA